MILFKEDWNRYPTAIVDMKTKNESFKEYCAKLKLMGVENYLFPLSLLNPALQGIDPFDPSLDADTRAMIFVECSKNIWYYLREVHRVPPMASAEGIPLKAHRGNIAYAWACMNHLSVGLTLPRQTGKSVIADAVNQWAKECAARNSEIILVTKDDSLRVANVAKMKKARLLLPGYIANISKQDADNSFQLTNVMWKNKYSTAIGQASVEAANKAARGLTSPIFQFDEAPFTKNIKIMVSAALPAFIAASAEARKYGNPYYIGYTTTAGKIDDADGAYMYKIFHEGMPWTEFLYDCKDREAMLRRIRRSSTGDADFVYINFLHYQLGYSDQWLYEALAITHSSGQAADRDYFNIWTNGTAEHPLERKVIEAIIASRQDITHLELSEREYSLNWYIRKDELERRISEGRKMIGGIDMSDGIGKDLITMVIIDEQTLEVMATFAVKETNILNFIEWICELMVKYPNLILNPENKQNGVSLIDSLLYKLPAMGIDPFKRIYNRIVDDGLMNDERYELVKQPLSKRPLQFYERNKTMFGFRTAGSGRHGRLKLYVDALQKAGNFGGHLVKDSNLAAEICSLSVKDGRIDHGSGLHDDRVIAWLLPVWMLSFSKNLQWYGINNALANTKDITKKDSELEENKNPYDVFKENREDEIRNKIGKLLEMIHQSNDNLIIDRITRQIKTLETRLTNVDSLPKSINELIDDAIKLRQDRIAQSNKNNYSAQPMRRIGMTYTPSL